MGSITQTSKLVGNNLVLLHDITPKLLARGRVPSAFRTAPNQAQVIQFDLRAARTTNGKLCYCG